MYTITFLNSDSAASVGFAMCVPIFVMNCHLTGGHGLNAGRGLRTLKDHRAERHGDRARACGIGRYGVRGECDAREARVSRVREE